MHAPEQSCSLQTKNDCSGLGSARINAGGTRDEHSDAVRFLRKPSVRNVEPCNDRRSCGHSRSDIHHENYEPSTARAHADENQDTGSGTVYQDMGTAYQDTGSGMAAPDSQDTAGIENPEDQTSDQSQS